MPSLKRNFDQQSLPHSSGFDIHRYIPEKLGNFSKVLIPLMLLVGGYSAVEAQDATGTEVAETQALMVIQEPVTLRDDPERRSDNAILDENNAPIILQPGTVVLIGNITENGGYRWGEVLQINGSPAPDGGVYIALDGNGYDFTDPYTPEAAPGPEAPLVVTEAPTEAATDPAVVEAVTGTESPLTSVSPTETAPVITPEALLTRENEIVRRFIEEGFVDSSFVLAPSSFSFGVDQLSIDRAEQGNAAIRDGVLGTGRPWIEGSLTSLGFSSDYIANYIDGGGAGLYMMGDAAVDRYLRDVRLGSWGTTMYVSQPDSIVPTLIPAFHSREFVEAQYGNIILRDTAVEEAVQGSLYRRVFELQAMYPDYFAYWGFPDQTSIVNSLSQNGHLRAFFEYAQHAAIQGVHQGWNNDSYSHRIGTSEIEGTFALRQEMINLVNTVMGTRYTTIQEVLPYFGDEQLLMELNFSFRNWSRETLGTEYNVWDAFGLYRDQGVSIQPLVDYDF